jgi:hypothetical protein
MIPHRHPDQRAVLTICEMSLTAAASAIILMIVQI